MIRRMCRACASWLVLPLWLLASWGCTTIEDGRGFAGLSGSLQGSFVGLDASAGRVGADGWFKTDNSFELKLSALQLTVRDLRLQSTATTAPSTGGCTFDPDSPPAGCALCHGGHCHCDGKLVSYEELRARPCGGASAATAATVATLPLGEALDLLARKGTNLANLSSCSPSCELEAGQVDSVVARVDRLKLLATLRDESLADRLGGKQPSVKVDWDLAGAAVVHRLAAAQKMDRATPYELRLTVELQVVKTLLDNVSWHTLTQKQGVIEVNPSSNGAAGETLSTNLAGSKLILGVERTDD